jgi:predicted methyltransferase
MLALAAAMAVAACGEPEPVEATSEPAVEPAPERVRALPGTLEWAAEGAWRLPAERNRDEALHRIEILRALGLDAAQRVLELDPGAGDWTAVLAPTLAARGGSYRAALMPAAETDEVGELAASFDERFADEELFGVIERTELGADTPALAPPGSIEAALTVDDAAAWMTLGYAEKAFADTYAALVPGGRLGLIAPRAPEVGPQDPGALNGYVQQSYVIRLAEEAGFALEAAAETLANPVDDADHPFGVWTLAPWRLTAPLGAPADPDFDRAPYDAIGEPDRMTLTFRKPPD